ALAYSALEVGWMQLRIEAEARDVVLRVLRPDGLQHADRHQVLRVRERDAQAHRALELAVVVLGLPRFAARLFGGHEKGRVVDDRRGREALLECRGIDE